MGIQGENWAADASPAGQVSPCSVGACVAFSGTLGDNLLSTRARCRSGGECCGYGRDAVGNDGFDLQEPTPTERHS